jgi:hypothetical protein
MEGEHMKSMTRVTAGLILLILTCLSNAMAAEVALFGPHLIERGTGKPVSENHTFSVPDPTGPFTLQIKTGDDAGNHRISSLSLSINGEKQASQDDFNQTVNRVEKSVALQSENSLAIKVNGAPGSFVEITILGNDGGTVISPTATLVVDPDIIEVGQTATLHWQTANADSVRLEPGVGVVPPTGSQQVSPEESTTYTLSATRGGQEVASSVTLTVTAVPLPPTVSVEVAPVAISPGEVAIISWQSRNADYVTIEPGVGTVDPNGSLAVSPMQTTTFLVTAFNSRGQASAQASLQVVQAPVGPSISFDDVDGQPLNGAQIGRSRLTISGVVHGELGDEVGVTVNGALAEVNGQKFIANRAPLEEGWNTLTVIATDSTGKTVESTVELFNSSPLVPIALSAERYNGVAPFNTTLSLDADLGTSITETDLKCTGSAPVLVVPADTAEYGVSFNSSGLYECLATVIDESGQTHRDRVGLQVWSVEELDQRMQVKWAAMKNAMTGGDVTAAASQFSSRSREGFQQQFEAFQSQLPQLADSMGPIRMVEVKENRAIYDMRTTKNGTEYSFQVEMIRDEDGIWRIWTF